MGAPLPAGPEGTGRTGGGRAGENPAVVERTLEKETSTPARCRPERLGHMLPRGCVEPAYPADPLPPPPLRGRSRGTGGPPRRGPAGSGEESPFPLPVMIRRMTAPSRPHRFCVAPMMGCTDRHARYLLRILSRRARLYTEMVPTGALLHGDAGRALRFDAAEHPVALQLGGKRSRGPRPMRTPRRGSGIRRGQPQRGLPQPASAARVLRGRPHGPAGPRRGVRGGHAGRGVGTDHGEDPHRDRRSRQLRQVPRLRGGVGRGGGAPPSSSMPERRG